MLLKDVFYAHQGCIYVLKILWNIITIKIVSMWII